MFVQSHLRDNGGNVKILLLPALPDTWKSGKVYGLAAHGGLTLDIEWSTEKVRAVFKAAAGGTFLVKFGSAQQSITLAPGGSCDVEFCQ